MRILGLDTEPFQSLPYADAGRRGTVVDRDLPLTWGRVDELPDDVDVLLVAADLQGRERTTPASAPPRLLGELLAERLDSLCAAGSIPTLDRVAVVLGGDLYARPALDRRGGGGDVRPVWRAFASRCRWVVGVGGNHDFLSETWSVPAVAAFRKEPRSHFLDGDVVTLDGMKFGGVSGIVGKPTRPFRRTLPAYLEAVERVLAEDVEVLVLHDGPAVPERGLLGMPELTPLLERAAPRLVVRGHCWWREPLVELPGGTQVLNVDARAVFLRRS